MRRPIPCHARIALYCLIEYVAIAPWTRQCFLSAGGSEGKSDYCINIQSLGGLNPRVLPRPASASSALAGQRGRATIVFDLQCPLGSANVGDMFILVVRSR